MFLVSSTTAVGIRDGGGDNGDGGVQLADNLKIFKTDNFDLDVYVQSKCQTMNEKVSLPACLLSLFRSCREI
jgi:exocyst complex component 8